MEKEIIIDEPISQADLDYAVEFYKGKGDPQQLPYRNMFGGQQSKEFYMGMLAAFTSINLASDMGYGPEHLKAFNALCMVHATMLVKEKTNLIIT